jgi:DNA-binding NarL/FixJ family response regulator
MSGHAAFAIVGPPSFPAGSAADRIAELELRLRHIGAEVRAAGVLDAVDGLPAASDYPQLAELTSRQWEILSRLLRGERVGTIARTLYLSPSTVRNHLAAIFRKFGVHSQLELVDLLRRRPTAGP